MFSDLSTQQSIIDLIVLDETQACREESEKFAKALARVRRLPDPDLSPGEFKALVMNAVGHQLELEHANRANGVPRPVASSMNSQEWLYPNFAMVEDSVLSLIHEVEDRTVSAQNLLAESIRTALTNLHFLTNQEFREWVRQNFTNVLSLCSRLERMEDSDESLIIESSDEPQIVERQDEPQIVERQDESSEEIMHNPHRSLPKIKPIKKSSKNPRPELDTAFRQQQSKRQKKENKNKNKRMNIWKHQQ